MSLEKLLELANYDLPPPLRRWFKRAVSIYMATDDTLDICLGLSRDDPQNAIGRRDRHLRQAAKYLKADRNWTMAVKLAAEIRRFESVIWPSWKLKPTPPEFASELRKHLFYARQHKRLPNSERHVHRILTRFSSMSENSIYNNS